MSLARVEVRTTRPYPVLVGAGALEHLARLDPARCALLADRAAYELHESRLLALRDAPRLVLTGGEEIKSLARLGEVLEFLAASDLDRGSTLVVFGGGTLGDLGGLAASLFLRGIAYVSCPTTLLAQVDACVGGKTAINLDAGKNLAGTFHQARLVLADTNTLESLPEEELRCGLGEAIKTALVGDPELLDLLEQSDAMGHGIRAELVQRCVTVKGGIVAEDEHESGRRAVLNLGHTFAHAIERAAGFGCIPHGQAVATGLALALEASARVGLLEDPELAGRIERLLLHLELPATLDALRGRFRTPLAPEDLVAGLRYDKKNVRRGSRFVLLRAAGKPSPGHELTRDLIQLLLA